MRIYLDNAATTPLSEEVIEAMLPYMRSHYGNPSSIHAEGRQSRAAIEEARKTVANYIGASIGEVFFTSGGTEANNMALKCAVRDLGVGRIISSKMEHHCVLHSVETLAKAGVQVDYVTIDNYGHVDYEHLEALLQQDTPKTLVSLMHANNEVGTLLDLERTSELCQQYDALLHSDTVQTIGHLPIDVNTVKINFLSGAAHKFHGPKGVGFLYINNNNIVKPFINGGAQERNMRGGTENVYGIVGLAKALELAYENLDTYQEQILSVRNYLKTQLEAQFIDIRFNGDLDDALYTLLSVSFPPSDKGDLLLLSLDIAGISVSGGSACSSGADVGSHVITALHGDPNRKTIRFSFSHENTIEEIDQVITKLKELLPELVKDAAKVSA